MPISLGYPTQQPAKVIKLASGSSTKLGDGTIKELFNFDTKGATGSGMIQIFFSCSGDGVTDDSNLWLSNTSASESGSQISAAITNMLLVSTILISRAPNQAVGNSTLQIINNAAITSGTADNTTSGIDFTAIDRIYMNSRVSNTKTMNYQWMVVFYGE